MTHDTNYWEISNKTCPNIIKLQCKVFQPPYKNDQLGQHDGTSSELYVCHLLNANNQTCFREFASLKSLRAHQRAKIGGQHGLPPIACLVLRNECPVCYSVFSSRIAATQHLNAAAHAGYCAVNFAYMPIQLTKMPAIVTCPICQTAFNSVEEYYAHASTHLPTDLSFKCRHCSIIFQTLNIYKTHQCGSHIGSALTASSSLNLHKQRRASSSAGEPIHNHGRIRRVRRPPFGI